MADMTTQSPPGVLSAADVAALWTEVARKQHAARVQARERENTERRLRKLKPRPAISDFKPLSARTVLVYLRESQDTPLPGGRVRRYAEHPMPAPAGRFGLMPWWNTGQRDDLIRWFTDRPGRDSGRGGWPAGRPRRVS